jgi:hypothetical protein
VNGGGPLPVKSILMDRFEPRTRISGIFMFSLLILSFLIPSFLIPNFLIPSLSRYEG